MRNTWSLVVTLSLALLLTACGSTPEKKETQKPAPKKEPVAEKPAPKKPVAQQPVKTVDHEAALKEKEIGLDFYRQGKYEEAMEHYKKALEFDPEFAVVYNNMGIIYRFWERSFEAEQAFRECLRLTGEDRIKGFAHSGLGTLFLQEERWEDARFQLEKALKYLPNDPKSLYKLGRARMELGDNDAALASFHQAVRGNPNDGLSYKEMGVLYAGKGQPKDAQNMFGLALKNGVDDFDVRVRLSYAMAELENFEGALEQVNVLFERHPDFSLVSYLRGEYSRKLRKDEDAAKFYARAHELAQNEENKVLVARSAKRVEYMKLPLEERIKLEDHAQHDCADHGGANEIEGEDGQDEHEGEGELPAGHFEGDGHDHDKMDKDGNPLPEGHFKGDGHDH